MLEAARGGGRRVARRPWRGTTLVGMLASIAVGLAACAAHGVAAHGVAPAVGRGPSAAEIVLYARVLRMADARERDPAVIEAALASRLGPLRAAAARAAGQVGDRPFAPRLRSLLSDGDSSVAASAALALGLLRDTASVPALAATLRPGAPANLARASAWSLGTIGTPARAAILRTLASAAGDTQLAKPLLLASARLHALPLDALRGFLASSDPAVRWRAAYAVERADPAMAAPALLPLVDDSSGAVRLAVADALRRTGPDTSPRPAALSELRRLARDPRPHVRVAAVRSLGTWGAVGAATLLAAIHDADANVRITAAQTLGPVLGSDRIAWRKAWRADTSLAFRSALLASAMRVDVVLPAARNDNDNPDTWRHRGDWRYRAAVADAGAVAPSIERMREESLIFARDPDPRVRVAGFAALAPHADTAAAHPWRREFMYFALQDADAYVRALAAAALTGHATAAEVPRVLASYRRARGDTVDDARLADVQFLAAAWARDSAHFGDSLRERIESLPVSASPVVRAAADDASIFAAWRRAPAPPPPHPLAWYETRVRQLIVPALRGVRPHARITTVRGTLELELFPLSAPLTVDNFLSLARSGFYDHLAFHRVVPDFVVQDGDPRGDGNGGPGYTIRDELNTHRYRRATVGMALSGPDTGGSQYFITLTPQPHLDGGYTTFGRVVHGFAALDALVQGDSIESIRVISPPK